MNQSRHAPLSGSQTRFTVPVSRVRRDGREDLVALGAEPAEHALQERDSGAIGIDAAHFRVDLQAVARAFHLLDIGQLANRGVENVERPVRLHRHLDLPPLPVGERVGVDALPLMSRTRRRCDAPDAMTNTITITHRRKIPPMPRWLKFDHTASVKTSTNPQANIRRT